jgi:hypothetical protein
LITKNKGEYIKRVLTGITGGKYGWTGDDIVRAGSYVFLDKVPMRFYNVIIAASQLP